MCFHINCVCFMSASARRGEHSGAVQWPDNWNQHPQKLHPSHRKGELLFLFIAFCSISASLLSPPSSSIAAKHGPCLVAEEKDPGFRNQVSEETSLHLLLGAWCGARSTPLSIHRNLFWQLSRDGNLNSLGMSRITTASPKLSFRAHWRVGDAMVGRRNAVWTTSKSGHSCPCQNCLQGPPAEKTGRGPLLNCPSCISDDPIGQGTELNELLLFVTFDHHLGL